MDSLLTTLANGSGNESIRLHIPRTLRLIYDIRNKRNAAHLAGGIDPNEQDASLVMRNMEWVLAEFVRLYHNVTPNDAHRIIGELVSRDVPVIQEFDGFPRILRDLRASEYCLVLLYWRGAEGATLTELTTWVRPQMRRNLRRTLDQMESKMLIHVVHDRVYITRVGESEIDSNKLIEPA